MVTVLFVVLVLFGFSKMLSVLDNQRISSSVSDYLRNEYRVSYARHSMTLSALRNLYSAHRSQSLSWPPVFRRSFFAVKRKSGAAFRWKDSSAVCQRIKSSSGAV